MANKAHTPREERSERTLGREVARYAVRRHGVVSTAELRRLGVGRGMITRWLEHGRLLRLHRGVYAVGAQPLGSLSRFRAAVLACGPGAALSHRSAAALWRIRRGYHGPVEVTTPLKRRSRKGIRVHVGNVPVVEKDGIPVTTPAQTIIDLADVLIERSVEQALALAEREGLVSREALTPIPGRRGAGVVARLADAHHVAFARSGLENWFIELIRSSNLPQPLFNHVLHGREVDAYWPVQRLVVEVDSWKYHSDPVAFTADRAKDALLVSKGERVMRIAEGQPGALTAIAGALGRTVSL